MALRQLVVAIGVTGVALAAALAGCAQGGAADNGEDGSAPSPVGDVDASAETSVVDARLGPDSRPDPGDGAPPACKTNADCNTSPKGKLCDTQTGACVECLVADDKCPVGQYCSPTDEKCAAGCRTNADCQPLGDAGAGEAGAPLLCAVATHACVGCIADADCPLGTVCDAQSSTCVPGCTPQHGCPSSRTCCTGSCTDTKTDVANCSACGAACDATHSNGASCAASVCTYTSCKAGYDDCNKAAPNTNGCETALNSPQSCSACGVSCDTVHSAGATCNGTTCAYASCASGYDDCDKTPPNANGCETPLSTALHCGACGNACDTVHSNSPACAGGVCTYASCKPGYDDCDKSGANVNGCETPVNTRQMCGACNTVCGNGTDCCNLTCTPTNTTQNCGACGNACTGSQICSNNQCVTTGTCQNAIPVTNGTYTGSTVGRPKSGGTPSCSRSTAPDVIFSFTAPRTASVTASLCSSGFDTLLYVGTTCGGSTVGCNDDSCGLQSSLTFSVTQGLTYYVVVTGYNANTGNYTLNISGM